MKDVPEKEKDVQETWLQEGKNMHMMWTKAQMVAVVTNKQRAERWCHQGNVCCVVAAADAGLKEKRGVVSRRRCAGGGGGHGGLQLGGVARPETGRCVLARASGNDGSSQFDLNMYHEAEINEYVVMPG